jgi:hypothetical protein
MPDLEWFSAGLLALIYGGSGLVELPMWRKMAADYLRWGYPRSWAIITPGVKILAAALVLIPRSRLLGASLCTIIAIAALATVLRVKDRARIAAASIVATLTVVAAVLILRKS